LAHEFHSCLAPHFQDLVMLSVYEGAYDARSRGLVRYVTSLMRLSWTQAELFENQLAHYLRGMPDCLQYRGHPSLPCLTLHTI
jgi:hypothetical protein